MTSFLQVELPSINWATLDDTNLPQRCSIAASTPSSASTAPTSKQLRVRRTFGALHLHLRPLRIDAQLPATRHCGPQRHRNSVSRYARQAFNHSGYPFPCQHSSAWQRKAEEMKSASNEDASSEDIDGEPMRLHPNTWTTIGETWVILQELAMAKEPSTCLRDFALLLSLLRQ